MYLKISIVLLFVFGADKSFAQNGCSLRMPTDLPKKEPVLLYAESAKAEYSLFRPSGELNVLPAESRLKLVCHGKKNAIAALKKVSVELICDATGNFVNVDTNRKYSLKELGCKSIPASDLLMTEDSCLNGKGKIIKSGFNIDGNFETSFEMCFDADLLKTYYAHNIINGASIKYSVKESDRRGFKADGMGRTTASVNKLYVQSNQKAVFEKLFGKSQPYISKTSFIARGHMAPDADFIFSYEQLATYYYANVAPEFQDVNAGNWLRVESLARSIAGELKDDVEAYTGTIGVLSLKNKPIYLDNDNLMPAPEYYFKVLKHQATDSAIVFISLNNPFASEADEMCKNVCKRAGFDDERFKDYKHGYTYCCELGAFRKVYSDLPKELTASKLLSAA